jgi:hypothetical protein
MSNSGYQVTNYFIEKVIKHFTKMATYSTPSNLYMALTSQGTELSGNSYGRATIKFGTASSLNDGTSEVKNLGEVLFATATGSWSADGFAIFDAQTSGNRMFNGNFAEAIEVLSSEQLKIEHEHLRLSLGLDHWSADAQERALDLAFAGGSYQPAGLYVALLKSVPKFDSETGELEELEELSGGGYARPQVSDWDYEAPSAVSQNKTNFATATAEWDAVLANAFFDAQQGGLFIGWDELNNPLYVGDGDDLEIDPGGAGLAF